MVNDTTRLLGLGGLVAERVELYPASTFPPVMSGHDIVRSVLPMTTMDDRDTSVTRMLVR
jgi:hypothetical protein